MASRVVHNDGVTINLSGNFNDVNIKSFNQVTFANGYLNLAPVPEAQQRRPLHTVNSFINCTFVNCRVDSPGIGVLGQHVQQPHPGQIQPQLPGPPQAYQQQIQPEHQLDPPQDYQQPIQSHQQQLNALQGYQQLVQLQQQVPPKDPYPSTPTSFPRFQELPTELQRKIWTELAFIRRNVDWRSRIVGTLVDRSGDYPGNGMLDFSEKVFQFYTTQPVPAILHACHDSRKVGREYYRPFGRTEVKNGPDTGVFYTSESTIWMHHNVDRVVPMGLDSYGQQWKMLWHHHNFEKRCAINVAGYYFANDCVDESTRSLPWLDGRYYENNRIHEEILLYIANDDIPPWKMGEIEFAEDVGFTEEEQAILDGVKHNLLTTYQTKREERRENYERRYLGYHRQAAPAGLFDSLYVFPVIKYVALVVEGRRRV